MKFFSANSIANSLYWWIFSYPFSSKVGEEKCMGVERTDQAIAGRFSDFGNALLKFDFS